MRARTITEDSTRRTDGKYCEPRRVVWIPQLTALFGRSVTPQGLDRFAPAYLGDANKKQRKGDPPQICTCVIIWMRATEGSKESVGAYQTKVADARGVRDSGPKSRRASRSEGNPLHSLYCHCLVRKYQENVLRIRSSIVHCSPQFSPMVER